MGDETHGSFLFITSLVMATLLFFAVVVAALSAMSDPYRTCIQPIQRGR